LARSQPLITFSPSHVSAYVFLHQDSLFTHCRSKSWQMKTSQSPSDLSHLLCTLALPVRIPMILPRLSSTNERSRSAPPSPIVLACPVTCTRPVPRRCRRPLRGALLLVAPSKSQVSTISPHTIVPWQPFLKPISRPRLRWKLSIISLCHTIQSAALHTN
jgi:hypothetical protein